MSAFTPAQEDRIREIVREERAPKSTPEEMVAFMRRQEEILHRIEQGGGRDA